MILLTGSSGFIGKSLCQQLEQQRIPIIASVRHPVTISSDMVKQVFVDSIMPDTAWLPVLAGVDVVIHLAARVHVMQDVAVDPLSEFRKTNTAGTLNLARQAADAGVRRFIFLSSIKVNGEHTTDSQPFTADDINIPTDPYGISKHEAEQGLHELALQTGMEVVIIRPPLVYGPGVKANFRSMIKWLSKGVPLPFGAIHNKRSLVALDNLTDLIMKCIDHPAAANQIFLVSDGEDLSTTVLLKHLSLALGKSNRLIPIPQVLLENSLRLLGKGEIVTRLFGSLQVDITKTMKLLDWEPPVSATKALHDTVQDWLTANN